MKTKKVKLAALLSIALLSTNAQVQVKEVGGFQNPESIVAVADKIFVSNLGEKLETTAKDGDGFISMLSRKDGKMLEEKFITGLNSPKGMIATAGKLIIADVDKVVIYNIGTKKKVWEADLSKEGVTYTNDLVRAAGGIYVSTTDKSTIYKISPSGKIKKLKVKSEIPGTNGLINGCGKIYVANYGHSNTTDGNFGQINKCSKKFKTFQTGGMYDGIVKVGHKLVITDWVSQNENTGRIVVYDVCKKKTSVVNIGRTINGPADLFADFATKTIWIPAMRENKILGLPFSAVMTK